MATKTLKPKKAPKRSSDRDKREKAKKNSDHKARGPHYSFQLTKRRDYARPIGLPGYWSFTGGVVKTLFAHKRLFILLVTFYVVLGVLLGTMTSQDTYNTMNGTVHTISDDLVPGVLGTVLQAGAISITTFLSSNDLTDIQKIYAGIIFLFTWLTTIWLLREIKAGRSPKLRDGIYNAGAPIVSTLLVVVWALVQLLPLALLSIAYSALANGGFISGGFGLFAFSMIAVLVVSLVLYWLTSTFIAAVAITLPGMYPRQALRAASEIVAGRRLRILLRILWMLLVAAIVWFVIMIAAITLDTWLASSVDWVAAVPWVPLVATFVSTLAIVWSSGYIYLMYRGIVDADAKR